MHSSKRGAKQSSVLRSGGCGAIFAILIVVILPLVHRIPFIPSRVDLLVAATLDKLDAIWPINDGDYLRKTGLSIYHPERYHGPSSWMTSGSEEDGFFEGYYYKLITDEEKTIVIIPGIIYSKEDKHGGFAFIMFAEPDAPSEQPRRRYTIHKFPLSSFTAEDATIEGDPNSWQVTIGNNTFSSSEIILSLHPDDTDNDITDGGPQHVEGHIELRNSTPFPSSIFMPDIMGLFAWLPFGECRHGIVSLQSNTYGNLTMTNGPQINKSDNSSTETPPFYREDIAIFTGGDTYVEKDWGASFPRTWIWAQASRFTEITSNITNDKTNAVVPGTFMLSIASIPFPSQNVELFRFRGFLGTLYLPNHGGTYKFATYTGAIIESLKIPNKLSESYAIVKLRTSQYNLEIIVSGDRDKAVQLHGPVPGGHFVPFVKEMLNANIIIKLTRRSDNFIIFHGNGKYCGLELETMELEDGGMRLLES
jgi:tocopherol cyclase